MSITETLAHITATIKGKLTLQGLQVYERPAGTSMQRNVLYIAGKSARMQEPAERAGVYTCDVIIAGSASDDVAVMQAIEQAYSEAERELAGDGIIMRLAELRSDAVPELDGQSIVSTLIEAQWLAS
jgi:hypothetical protein